MASFKLNPDFEEALNGALEEFVREFAQACRDVIEIERYWDGWTTSNPLRDIVDTNALNVSMEVFQVKTLTYRIRWATAYVVYVYLGYALQDGRRIPARKWVEIAMNENDLLSSAAQIINDVLGSY